MEVTLGTLAVNTARKYSGRMDEMNAGQLAPGGYPDVYAEKEAMEIRKPTQRERLMVKRQRLAAQLASVDAALNALDENPNLEKFLEVMARAS